MSTQVTTESPILICACLPPYHPVLAMTSSVFVLLSCLLLAARSADRDNNQQIEQMMSKMAAKMFEVEEKVLEVRAEMREKDREMGEMRKEMAKGMNVMREEIGKKNRDMEVMREEMMKEMREEMEEKVNKVKKQLDVLEARNTELTTKLRKMDQKSTRDLPFILTCATRDTWTTPSATITYDRLTVDYNNSGRPGGGDGELNISTGKFTALTPGHYTITYSGESWRVGHLPADEE